MTTAELKASNTITEPRATMCELLALFALVFYVVTNTIFVYCPFLETYPQLIAFNPIALCNCASLAFAATSIVLKPKVLLRSQMSLIVFSMAVFLVSASRTGDFRFAHACLMLTAVAGIDFTRISVTYYRAVLVTILVLMLMSILGAQYNKDVIPNSRIVFAFGFAHPNALGAFLFSAISAMSYTCWAKKTWPVPMVLAAVSALFCYFCLDSHASAAILGLLALSGLLGHSSVFRNRCSISRRAFVVVLIAVPAVLLATMLVSAKYYDSSNPVFACFNQLTHGRLYFGHHYYINHDGFTFLGRPLSSVTSYHNGMPFANIDSGYCFVPLVNGIASLLALAMIYITAILRLSRTAKNLAALSILLIAALYLLVESYALFPASSFAAILLAEAFVPKATQGST